jgi:glycosyltransferase involved in cell wall biosynthesis
MRIAVVPTPNLKGQSGSVLHSLAFAETLASQGADVHLIAAAAPEIQRVRVHLTPIAIAHPIVEDLSTSPTDFYQSVMAIVSKLLEVHSESPIDVVHGFYASFTGYAVAVFGAITSVRSVMSCFGRDVNQGMASHPVGRRLGRLAVNQVDDVIAATDDARSSIETLGRSSRLHLVPVGVNEQIFHKVDRRTARAALGISADQFLVLAVVSHMLEDKGVDRAIQGTAPFLRRHPGAALHVVGPDYDGANGARPGYETLATNCGVSGQVVFLGRKPHPQIPLYMCAANVLVDARRVGNFSSALMEAIACGVPTVVSTAVSRQLRSLDAPCLVFTDANALDAALEKVHAEPAFESALSTETQSWWRQHRGEYGLVGTTKTITGIYEASVRTSGGQTPERASERD